MARTVIPALLVHDSTSFEEGAYFIDGDMCKQMLEISPDGFICVEVDEHSVLKDVLGDIAVEIKCSYPNESQVTVHYKIPVYYGIQLLCHMTVKKVKRAWYGSYSEQSIVVIELQYDEKVCGWNVSTG